MNAGLFMIGAALVAWVLAQLIKIEILVKKQHGVDGLGWKTVLKSSMKSGGMPSGHTACLSAATMFLGLEHGFDSEAFAFAVIVLAIVAYDAVNVRWAVGKHGKMLNELLKRRTKIVEGHTVPEMLVGLLLGIIIGAGFFAIYKQFGAIL